MVVSPSGWRREPMERDGGAAGVPGRGFPPPPAPSPAGSSSQQTDGGAVPTASADAPRRRRTRGALPTGGSLARNPPRARLVSGHELWWSSSPMRAMRRSSCGQHHHGSRSTIDATAGGRTAAVRGQAAAASGGCGNRLRSGTIASRNRSIGEFATSHVANRPLWACKGSNTGRRARGGGEPEDGDAPRPTRAASAATQRPPISARTRVAVDGTTAGCPRASTFTTRVVKLDARHRADAVGGVRGRCGAPAPRRARPRSARRRAARWA